MSKKSFYISVLIAVVVIAGVFIWLNYSKQPRQVACTLEAKICPDGSAVGRSGPNCEFAACPAPSADSGWKTFTDAANKISFRYPESLNKQNIFTQEWPPKITVSDNPYFCDKTVSGKGSNVPDVEKVIGGRTYCVKTTDEGAAGTTYSTYKYSVELNGKLISLAFVLRYPQCGNYDEPAAAACKSERASFDLDGLIDQIVQSVENI